MRSNGAPGARDLADCSKDSAFYAEGDREPLKVVSRGVTMT